MCKVVYCLSLPFRKLVMRKNLTSNTDLEQESTPFSKGTNLLQLTNSVITCGNLCISAEYQLNHNLSILPFILLYTLSEVRICHLFK